MMIGLKNVIDWLFIDLVFIVDKSLYNPINKIINTYI